ncbi:MAG: hypothetical protein ACRD3W_28905, partial [Terriglobales bacterium]
GCDIVKEYVDIAAERVAALRNGMLRTRPMNRPVYDPARPYGGHKPTSGISESPPALFAIAARSSHDE